MRKYIVAGNWKMNTTVPEGVALAKAVVEKGKDLPANVELVVAPPFTHLAPVAEALKGSKVALSAQNCADHWVASTPSSATPSAVSTTARPTRSSSSRRSSPSRPV